LFVRIFDPDTAGRFDTRFPAPGENLTRFTLFGREGASRMTDPAAAGRESAGGTPLWERTFGADRSTDGRWVTIAEAAAEDGDAVGDRRLFRLEVAGIAGSAGNVYDVAVSVRSDANEAPADLRVSVIHPTLRIPN